jgi:hypothetical protein
MVPAHKHQLVLATYPRESDDPNHRDLMACGVRGCVHTEVVCQDCVTEGRKESVPGAHTHASDGTITRALSFLPKVKPIRPPDWVYAAPLPRRRKSAR